MGTLLILALLAVVWAGVGVHWLKTRRPLESLSFSGGRALGAFDRQRGASVVPLRGPAGPVGGRGGAVAPYTPVGHRPPGSTGPRPGVSSAEAAARRRTVLVALAALALVTLLAAMIGGTAFLLFHLLVDAVLLAYVVAIVQYQREVEAAKLRVRPLRAPQRRPLAATGTDSVRPRQRAGR